MEPILRLCVADVDQVLMLSSTIPRNEVTNIKPSFEGGVGYITNAIVDIFWYKNMNYTVIERDSFGKGGCQTSMANNESDFGVAIVDFPVDEDFEKVNPFMLLFEEPLVILQAYNKTVHKPNLADIVQQSVSSFSTNLWILFSVMLFLIGLFFKVRQYTGDWELKQKRLLLSRPEFEHIRRRKKKKPGNTSDPFFQVLSLFMQTDVEDYDDAYRRILSLILSIASFVSITGYFCNLMSTDMVTVERPIIISSYQDIIDKKTVVPVFAKQLTDYEHFKNAPEGSREQKFWTIMTTERSSEDEVLIDPQGLETLLPKGLGGAMGYYVLIVSKLVVEPVRFAACKMKNFLQIAKEIMPWTAKDPQSPNYQKGFIVRQNNMPFIQSCVRRGRLMVEGGLIFYFRREVHSIIPEGVFQGQSNPDDLRQCLSTELLVDKPGYQAAGTPNFKILGMICAAGILPASSAFEPQRVVRDV